MRGRFVVAVGAVVLAVGCRGYRAEQTAGGPRGLGAHRRVVVHTSVSRSSRATAEDIAAFEAEVDRQLHRVFETVDRDDVSGATLACNVSVDEAERHEPRSLNGGSTWWTTVATVEIVELHDRRSLGSFVVKARDQKSVGGLLTVPTLSSRTGMQDALFNLAAGIVAQLERRR